MYASCEWFMQALNMLYGIQDTTLIYNLVRHVLAKPFMSIGTPFGDIDTSE